MKFKAKWRDLGWVVCYSHLGILWVPCSDRQSVYTTYRIKADADTIAINLQNGIAPEGWYK
jgi:hypothetical protein